LFHANLPARKVPSIKCTGFIATFFSWFWLSRYHKNNDVSALEEKEYNAERETERERERGYTLSLSLSVSQ
jgi:hypothetical protein